MAMTETEDTFFRDVEVNILDKHHESFPLWQRKRASAIYAALAQFDCMAVLSLLPIQMNHVGQVQVLKRQEEGLSQAMRWLYDGKNPIDVVALLDKEIIEEAGVFCHFGAEYTDIADMHKMLGRKLIDVEVSIANREITFKSITTGVTTVTGLAENAQRQFSLTKSIEELSTFRHKLEKVFQTAKFHEAEGHIVIDELGVINDPIVCEYLTFGLPEERINLPPSTDLGQFRLEEFDVFYRALRRWSYCSTTLFLSALTKHGREQWYCAPTQVVRIDYFIRAMSQLTGLAEDVVNRITTFLKYDARTRAPDIFQQPLIMGKEIVAWSSHVVQSSQYQRNMLKLLARTKNTERKAANLIGSNFRQKSMLNDIGELLSRKGKCAFKLNTEIKAGNDKGEIDLLAYSTQHPEDVLLIEGKAVLGVDEINEVDAATTEMIIGQGQLNDIIKILKAMPNNEKHDLFKFVKWDQVKNYYGVVVAADAEPNDRYDHRLFPGLSLETMKLRLNERHYQCPRKLWNACQSRNWLADLKQGKERSISIRIQDVTYRLPALAMQAQS